LSYAVREDIEQAIQIIPAHLARANGVMLPEFGAGLRDFVFEPNSHALADPVGAPIARRLRTSISSESR
jgi:phage baseplate assembly protein W